MKITSADISSLLSQLSVRKIRLLEIEAVSELAVEASISRVDYSFIADIAKKRGDRVEIKQKGGIYWSLMRIFHRPVLVGMLIILAFGAIFLPGRIFFVRVEGNSAVPTRLILARAEECGISFGASRREVRSEKMKNALLEAIPELKWAGVNTSGCVAIISVTEGTQTTVQETGNSIASIVAARDGIITDCTVTKGNVLCKVGQAVKEGEVLVSGYTDCGFKIQAAAAEGEIYGITERVVQVNMPWDYLKKGSILKSAKKYSLLIGKNKINFLKDSGISPTECDKMYSEYYLTLPGGFQLPVALVVEEYIYYADPVQSMSAVVDETALCEFAEQYLSGQMLSGTILDRAVSLEQLQDSYVLNAQYTCRELIGRVQSEEIIRNHGEND